MRFTTPLVAALILAAAPALAQSPSGNVAQPERAVPQAGNTTNGPIDNPSTRGMSRDPGPGMSGPAGTGSVESAKGGNADQNNKPVGNTGNTSGGPAR